VPKADVGARAAQALRVPIARPSFGPEELEAVQQPLHTGWVVQGPFVGRFEERFAAYIGGAHAAATTSCTTALHLAVAVLGLKPHDEVIVPAFTWVSTANVVEYMGAKPVFCDVDLETFNIDVTQIEALIGPNTVGIIPVHLFGLCADMDAVNAIARRHGLWVVEDAACGFGAWQNDRHAGTLGDLGAFSFHPRKSITTGEGGMLTTARADWDELARSLRDHGADRSDYNRHESRGAFLLADFNQLGFNYRMTDLQGALGCVQLDRADWILDERRRRARLYDEALAGLDWLRTPVTPAGNVHGYQSYCCLFAPEAPELAASARLHDWRNRVMGRMEEQGIATRQGTHAPVLTSFYANRYDLGAEAFPRAVMAERLTLALPLYPDMNDADQELVVTELLSAFEAI
jgi:dTDP-4-amino-4,6-dideoxygalactose transaminase